MQANAKDMAEDQRILRDIVLPAIGDLKGRLIVGLKKRYSGSRLLLIMTITWKNYNHKKREIA